MEHWKLHEDFCNLFVLMRGRKYGAFDLNQQRRQRREHSPVDRRSIEVAASRRSLPSTSGQKGAHEVRRRPEGRDGRGVSWPRAVAQSTTASSP